MIRKRLVSLFSLGIFICFSIIVYKCIEFHLKCEIPLKNVLLADNIPEMKVNMDKAVQFVEQNRLTTGYSSLFFKNREQYHLTSWYANLKFIQRKIDIACAKGYTRVDELNLQIEVISTLSNIPDDTDIVYVHDIVYVPKNISLSPLYEGIWILLLILVLGLIFTYTYK